MTEREAIKNEVLAIVAEALRAGEQRGGSNWDHMDRAAAVVERAITKETLDLPTMEDCAYFLRSTDWMMDARNVKMRDLARRIVEGKARIVEVDK